MSVYPWPDAPPWANPQAAEKAQAVAGSHRKCRYGTCPRATRTRPDYKVCKHTLVKSEKSTSGIFRRCGVLLRQPYPAACPYVEASAFDKLAKTAQRSIDRNDKDFEHHLDKLKGKNFEILWRQDWFVAERFKWMISSPHLVVDKHRFEELTQIGTQLMCSDDIEKLRVVVAQLSMIQIGGGPDNEMFDVANIIRG